VEAAGYEALVLTVDAPVQGARDRERRAGFRFACRASARSTWPDGATRLPAGASCLDLLLGAPTWDDVHWLQGITRLPVLLKGVLHPDDARQAASSVWPG
jgi:4-hydroxymandelate oxidase